MKRVAGVVLVILGAVTSLGFASCGGESDAPKTSDPDVVGTYVLDVPATKAAWVKQGQEMDDEDERRAGLEPQLKALEQGKFSVTTTLAPDGTVNSKTLIHGTEEAASGTWTLAGSKIALDVEVRIGHDHKAMPGNVHIECTFAKGMLEVLRDGRVAWVMKRAEPER